jgi:hypothetical protein
MRPGPLTVPLVVLHNFGDLQGARPQCNMGQMGCLLHSHGSMLLLLLLLLPLLLHLAVPTADTTETDLSMPAWTHLDRIIAFGPWGPTAGCRVRTCVHITVWCLMPFQSLCKCPRLLLNNHLS